MEKISIAIFLLAFAAANTLDAVDAGNIINISSVDIVSVANMPLNYYENPLLYSGGGMAQLNIKIDKVERLSLCLRAGGGEYDSADYDVSGLYNFSAVLGIGYRIPLGKALKGISFTPGIYGGILGHVLKSDTDTLSSIVNNLKADQFYGADLEIAYRPLMEEKGKSLGLYIVGAYSLYSKNDSFESHLGFRAGMRLNFQ